jgi:hypothetical protein
MPIRQAVTIQSIRKIFPDELRGDFLMKMLDLEER